nr:polysaccharide pyruvyl transferase family protein [Enterobacter chuandaensis]
MFTDNISSKIGVLNTCICSMNVGDFIIMDSAQKQLSRIFKKSQKVLFPTHERITRVGMKRQKEIAFNILCGTNCLNSSMFLHRQWNVGLLNSLFMKEVISLGVGWADYQSKPDLYTSTLLKKMFSKKYTHSVRDSYTEKMLKAAGIHNTVNTACATMWDLTEEHCNKIPKRKSRNVIFTLTDYRKDIEKDRVLIQSLKKAYSEVFFWTQGSQDYAYLKSFGSLINGIKIAPANLSDFDHILINSPEIDYVGTRLHAGIRALQKHRRSMIIAVDNRAEEKRKDFNIHVIPRDMTTEDYVSIFNENHPTEIWLPEKSIAMWKSQFEH